MTVDSLVNHAYGWEPMAHVDVTPLEELGYVTLMVDTPADVDVSYRYHWRSETGAEWGSTSIETSPHFNFIVPHDGRFLLSADIVGVNDDIRTVAAWVDIARPKTRSTRPEVSDDAEVVIDVDDVSMTFNIASEQFNSLKEYFIALAHRELSFKPFKALDHISFQVRRGDAMGLVGTNGSGKSTMLKIIAGVLNASEGTCSVHGTIAPLIELGAGFDMELTARENIYLNGALLGYRRDFIDEHFDDIVDFAELRDFMDMPLKNYSSGMVARIAFSVATVTEPDILIVDETLSVGDFLFQQKCEARIQELIDSTGVTVLLVSHSVDLVERVCNRACWIEKGKLRMAGAAGEVCGAYRQLEA